MSGSRIGKRLPALRIVGTCIAAAIGYGVVHDLVTAHLSVEYFTIGHPPVFDTEDPVLLALGWGTIATWWVGLSLGLPLAFAALRGPRPVRTARSLTRSIVVLLLVMAACALLAGLLGAWLASAGAVVLLEPLASRIPDDRHVPFLAALWAHGASYLVGFGGGAVLVVRTWRSRRRHAVPGGGGDQRQK